MSIRTALMAAAAIAAGAGLAACQRNQPQVAALPLDTGAAQPLGEAPPPGGLPPAPPAPIATLADYHDAYAFPDRAWGMSWAFGDSPPDYGFYDDGVSPWVWIADDDSECLAEPVPGGERYYYFEPGAYTPFYVQDPSYGYGFENGQLAAIYARDGRQIPPAQDPTAAATAGRYLARGRTLRQAAATQPHQAVAAANWNARRGLIASERSSFSRDAAQNPAWLAYHGQHAPQDQDRFAAEAARRENWAAQTDTRLGEASRATREQRLAQSIGQGVGPGRPSAPAPAAQAPALALNRYAAPAPARARTRSPGPGAGRSVRAAARHRAASPAGTSACAGPAAAYRACATPGPHGHAGAAGVHPSPGAAAGDGSRGLGARQRCGLPGPRVRRGRPAPDRRLSSGAAAARLPRAGPVGPDRPRRAASACRGAGRASHAASQPGAASGRRTASGQRQEALRLSAAAWRPPSAPVSTGDA